MLREFCAIPLHRSAKRRWRRRICPKRRATRNGEADSDRFRRVNGVAAGLEKVFRSDIGPMNDLFAGDLSEADMVGYVTTIQGKLLENKTLAAQAATNNEEQFALGDFKTILTDIILDGQEGHNRIAEQMLKDERTFTAMQGLLARAVYAAFRERAGRRV